MQSTIQPLVSSSLPSALLTLGTKIRCFAWSPDNRFLAVATKNLIHLWDAQTKHFRFILDYHQHKPFSLAWSPDGLSLAVGYRDVIRIWKISLAKNLVDIQSLLLGNTGPIHTLFWLPTQPLLISASQDQSIRLWDLSQMASIAVLKDFASPISALSLSPDSHSIAVSFKDLSITVFALPS